MSPFVFGNRVWLLAIASGAAVAVGLWVLVMAIVPRPVRLADALDRIEGRSRDPVTPEWSATGSADWGDRLGAWLYRRSPLPLSARTVAALASSGRSVSGLMARKAIFGLTGLVAPLVIGAVLVATGSAPGPGPLVVSLIGGLAGWFLPDLQVMRAAPGVHADASEAVFTLIDLVTLERLSNQSATQALHSAAGLSNHPVFVTVRASLERSRLEQRAPWQGLEQVALDLDLPQLADIADTLRLDEQGAALSGALRARVRELRNQHLMDERIAAQRVSESLTLWMVIPALTFGLVLMAPPLMRLMAN